MSLLYTRKRILSQIQVVPHTIPSIQVLSIHNRHLLEMPPREGHTTPYMVVLHPATSFLERGVARYLPGHFLWPRTFPSPILTPPFAFITKSYHKSLAMHMINAAKLCIPLYWNSSQTPTLKDWLTRIRKVAKMEKLIPIARDTPTRFNKKWACWTHYQTTSEYLNICCPPT